MVLLQHQCHFHMLHVMSQGYGMESPINTAPSTNSVELARKYDYMGLTHTCPNIAQHAYGMVN